MASKKTSTTRSTKPKITEAVESTDTAVVTESVVITNADCAQAPVVQKPQVELTDLVCVQSCFHGTLYYKSKKTGVAVEWQRFGEEQYFDVDELMYMRNTQPKFFKEQWIRLIGDNADDVFAFLRLDRYCKNNLKFDDFEDMFKLSPDELETAVKDFTASLKESFARRAKELFDAGELDNLKIIKAIERATNFKLLE